MSYVFWPASVVETAAGDDIVWYFQVRDAAGAVVDITGWTFGFWAVDQHDSANIITVTNTGFTILTAAAGLGKFTIARATTLLQGGKVFRGEIWRVDNGANKKLASGSWKITRAVRS